MNWTEYKRLRKELAAKHRTEREELVARFGREYEPTPPGRRSFLIHPPRSGPAPAFIKGVTARETCLLNRGRLTAAEIAKQIGISRNAVIGQWYRGRRGAQL
jgi:hypothetical protein